MLEKLMKDYFAGSEEQVRKELDKFQDELTRSAEQDREKVARALETKGENGLYNAIGRNVAKFLAEKGPMTAEQIHKDHPSVARLSLQRFWGHLDYAVEHGFVGLRRENGEAVYFAPEAE